MNIKIKLKRTDKISGQSRIYRRLLAGILALALLWTICPAVQGMAAETSQPLELYVQDAAMSEDGLKIYVSTNIRRSETELSPEQFSVTLGDTRLPCTGMEYFSDSDEPVSYVYLVDVSGSIDGSRLEEMKEYLRLVTAGLRANDRVCLITLGNTLSIGEFTSGRENINNQIEAIEGLYDDTNLYYGIVESLELLSRQGDGKKVLLILSDGEDEQASGITREEVDKAIEEYTIPIYTAAMLGDHSDTASQEFAKILGSFARLSAGGIHTAFGVEDITLENSAARMAASIDDSIILTADVSGYETGSGQAYLQVDASVDGSGSAVDSIVFLESRLSDGQAASGDAAESGSGAPDTDAGTAEESASAETSAATESAPAESTSDSDAAADSEAGENDSEDNTSDTEKEGIAGLPVWVFIVAGAAVILILVIILIIISSSKKKKRRAEEAHRAEEARLAEEARRAEEARLAEESRLAEEEPQTPEAEAGDEYPVTGSLDKPTEAEESDNAAEDMPEKDNADHTENAYEPDKEGLDITAGSYDPKTGNIGNAGNGFGAAADDAQAKGIVVYLTKIGVSEMRTYQIVIQGETTLGRSPARARYAFPEDLHMSSLHCSLNYFDNRIIICDKGSMNGTKVNGVPITGPYPLKCDDVIQIGNSEFRIHW